MKLKSNILIHAERQAVWDLLTDVDQFPTWLPKCVEVVWNEGSGITVGSRLLFEREWKGETRVGEVEVLELRAPECIRWQETLRGEPSGTTVESYRLIERRKGVEVQREVVIHAAGLPRWASWLVAVLSTLGRPVGKTGLMRLKELVEKGQ